MPYGKITIISNDGTITEQTYDRKATLKELQKMVGGLIERVPYFEEYNGLPCVVWVNENGKLDGNPFNQKATTLWHDQFPAAIGNDFLVGTVIIMQGDRSFLA